MFLIDSSAWIEYLRPKGSIKVKERIRNILQKEEAVSCGIVSTTDLLIASAAYKKARLIQFGS